MIFLKEIYIKLNKVETFLVTAIHWRRRAVFLQGEKKYDAH